MDRIKMNFPPDYVGEYVKKWLEQAKKEKRPAAELAMISDIATMVGIAKGVMRPDKKEINQSNKS